MNLSPELDRQEYHALQRISGHRRSVLSAVTASDGLKLLKRQLPALSRAEHLQLCHLHATAVIQHRDAWSNVADEAAMQTFGRAFCFTDYKISGIASDSFSETHKERLRHHCHCRSNHAVLTVYHYMAAGHRHATAVANYRKLTST